MNSLTANGFRLGEVADFENKTSYQNIYSAAFAKPLLWAVFILIMQETVKKLKIKGLYVVSMKSSSFRWCKLMSEKHELPIRNYTSKPIEKITDFIKLFEESLSHLDWNLDEYTNEHGEAILKMERRLQTNELGRWVVS